MYKFPAISTSNEDYYVEKKTRKVKAKKGERTLKVDEGRIDGKIE